MSKRESHWEKASREWDERIEREAREQHEKSMLDSSFKTRYEGVQAADRWLEHQQGVLDEQLAALQPQRDQVHAAELSVQLLTAELFGVEPRHLSISTFWDCKYSPVGTCIYDDSKDRSHDNCLVCHEPSERK